MIAAPKSPSNGAARQCQRNAGREIQSDQNADVGNTDAEFAAQQRRDGGNALKLERHGGANRKQYGKNAPAIAQRFHPR
jgi:hypothetical protein